MERLIDLAARRHGFDRLALRRQKLVPPPAMPYANPFGIVYDRGHYASALLAGGFAGRLGTVGPDGWPYVVPLLYVFMDG